jgi:hypothetical protein
MNQSLSRLNENQPRPSNVHRDIEAKLQSMQDIQSEIIALRSEITANLHVKSELAELRETNLGLEKLVTAKDARLVQTERDVIEGMRGKDQAERRLEETQASIKELSLSLANSEKAMRAAEHLYAEKVRQTTESETVTRNELNSLKIKLDAADQATRSMQEEKARVQKSMELAMNEQRIELSTQLEDTRLRYKEARSQIDHLLKVHAEESKVAHHSREQDVIQLKETHCKLMQSTRLDFDRREKELRKDAANTIEVQTEKHDALVATLKADYEQLQLQLSLTQEVHKNKVNDDRNAVDKLEDTCKQALRIAETHASKVGHLQRELDILRQKSINQTEHAVLAEDRNRMRTGESVQTIEHCDSTEAAYNTSHQVSSCYQLASLQS